MRRYALSTLVNTLLENEKPVPFEFLVNGSFLRTSLEEYLTANGISAENTLSVEYVRAIIPPLYLSSFEHDAWVSSVDVLSATSVAGKSVNNAGLKPGHERILSAGFDGVLRVWNTSSQVMATSAHFKGPSIRSAKFLSPSQIVSAGDDCTIKIWKHSEDPEISSSEMSPKLNLLGHKGSVESIAVHNSSNRMLSACADGSVGLWSTKKSDAPPAPTSEQSRSNKRRKVSNVDSAPQRGPLSLMKAHSDCVSVAVFAPHDPTVAYSSSWDHSLKTWDLTTSNVVDNRRTDASIFSLTALPTVNLLAAGSSDKYIALIDPRTSATRVTAMTLRGHTNSVSCLAIDPDSSYGLASGSHDGTCRVWDIRSTSSEREGRVGKSIYTIFRESVKGESKSRAGGEGVKIFDIKWDSIVGIISASEDKRVQVNKGSGLSNNDTQKAQLLL